MPNFEILPQALYHHKATRLLDQTAIQEFHIPGFTLMRRAGRSAFQLLQNYWPNCKTLSIFCGSGNNGGDGLIIAGLAKLAGLDVQLILLSEQEKLSGDAKAALNWAIEQGAQPGTFSTNIEIFGNVIVDAIFGTGLNKDIEGLYKTAIDCINHHPQPVFAIDIPSGLDCDTGKKLGSCINADITMTFIGLKTGLFTHYGTEQTGKLYFSNLNLTESIYQKIKPTAKRIDINCVKKLSPRHRNSHKGHFGQVLVIGGDYGMGGAVIMAAEAAARVGAGCVSAITQPQHISPLLSHRPEIMAHEFTDEARLTQLIQQTNVVVIGPGLGRTNWSKQLFQHAIHSDKPLIIDADALNLLASSDFYKRMMPMHAILTPHPGEAARLLDTSIETIQADRLLSAQKLFAKYQQVIILKGCGTVVCSGKDAKNLAICSDGNPGMSSGGMGDVLSGTLGGLLAQGLSLSETAELGVCLHAAAGDLVAENKGERGLLATDLFNHIQKLSNLN